MKITKDGIYTIVTDGKEWKYAWGELSKQKINIGQEDPFECECEGEFWQYIDSGIVNGVLVHEFRHRHHPVTLQREYIRIPVKDRTALI